MKVLNLESLKLGLQLRISVDEIVINCRAINLYEKENSKNSNEKRRKYALESHDPCQHLAIQNPRFIVDPTTVFIGLSSIAQRITLQHLS